MNEHKTSKLLKVSNWNGFYTSIDVYLTAHEVLFPSCWILAKIFCFRSGVYSRVRWEYIVICPPHFDFLRIGEFRDDRSFINLGNIDVSSAKVNRLTAWSLLGLITHLELFDVPVFHLGKICFGNSHAQIWASLRISDPVSRSHGFFFTISDLLFTMCLHEYGFQWSISWWSLVLFLLDVDW